MANTYKIVRFFQRNDLKTRVVKRGLSLEEARAHCRDPETSSATCKESTGKTRTAHNGEWFDGYEAEE